VIDDEVHGVASSPIIAPTMDRGEQLIKADPLIAA
jgi:hypothetical protein